MGYYSTILNFTNFQKPGKPGYGNAYGTTFWGCNIVLCKELHKNKHLFIDDLPLES